MRKFYLLDDNRHQQIEKFYFVSHLFDTRYQDILEMKQGFYPQEDYDFLKNALAVFIHNTFPDRDKDFNLIDGSYFLKTKIEDFVRDSNIPFVIFSEGFDYINFNLKENPLLISQINKRIFYANMEEFLEHYKTTERINFEVLAYGKNFITHYTEPLFNKIFDELAVFPSEEIFDVGQLSSLKLLENYYKSTNSEQSFDDFLFSFIDAPVSVGEFLEFLELINKSLIQHGKNIHLR